MIAISFSQLEGWVSFLYLVAVVAVTIRLLRNLDAFSLDVLADPKPDTAQPENEAAQPDPGEGRI
jgi:hypothetical protein